jgi:hypothetical protein
LILLFQTLPFVVVPMLSFAVIALDRAAVAIGHAPIKRKESSAVGSGHNDNDLHNHIVGITDIDNDRPTGTNTNYSSAVISRWRRHRSRLIATMRLALAYPVYIGKPLAGVLTLAELLAIVGILVMAMYNFGRLTHLAAGRIDAAAASSAYSK